MSETQQMPEPDGQVSDAPENNWVDRWAPIWARPYLRLSRADRPIGTWLLLLPCWWGLGLAVLADPRGATWHDLWIAAGCLIGAFLMRGAGCTWNDITDRKIDAQVARTRSRPLPSGQVTVKQAAIWMGVQAILAAAVLITFNKTAILLGVASLMLVAIYPFAKRFTWWPQVFLGLAFNWGVILAWAARSGDLAAPALILYAAGISWTLFYDTIYAHQDKEDDALIGVKSTARLFADQSKAWLRLFLMVSVLFFSTAIIWALVASQIPPAKLGVALLGVWAFGWHLGWQLGQLDTEDPENCLRIFQSNRNAGLIPALFIAAGVLV